MDDFKADWPRASATKQQGETIQAAEANWIIRVAINVI